MSRIVTFGEIMARLAPPGYQRFQQAMPGAVNLTFAGAEASIAAAIAYMGGEAAFVTALPDHAIAEACVADLRSLGVETRHIVSTPQGRLGLYYFEPGVNQRAANVIYDREGSSVAVLLPDAYDWEAIFADAEWFLISGITPAISRNAAAVAFRAVHEASLRGVQVACDMNYRAKLWQWDPPLTPRELATRTMVQLMEHVDLFIGGREDAIALLGATCSGSDTPDATCALARQLTQQFPRLVRAAMTLREGVSASHNRFGGMLYERGTDTTCFAPMEAQQPTLYDIPHIVDRLGAGDAFTAGLLFALTTPALTEPSRAVAYAAAAGCLAHSIEGDYNYVSRAEIEALMAGEASGRVRR